jgi:hypothetical protein
MACSSVEAAHAFRDCLAANQAASFGYFEVDTMEWPGGPICVRGTDTFEAWVMQQHDQTPEAPGSESNLQPVLQRTLAVTTDATRRVLSAQALQATYQTLEQRVEERTHELWTLLEVSRSRISTLALQHKLA